MVVLRWTVTARAGGARHDDPRSRPARPGICARWGSCRDRHPRGPWRDADAAALPPCHRRARAAGGSEAAHARAAGPPRGAGDRALGARRILVSEPPLIPAPLYGLRTWR